jgi:hypothetical protein
MRFYTPDEVKCIMEGIGFHVVSLDAARHIFVHARKKRV